MNEERFAAYIDSLEPDRPALFLDMEEYARERHIPILRPGTASLLETLVMSLRPRRILEIGTAIGYSGIRMLSACPDAALVTLEIDPERCLKARGSFERAGLKDRVTLIQADAGEALRSLKGRFDFVFLDGPKAQYPAYLPAILDKMNEGAMMVTDNVLQEGRLLDSRYAVIRRDRTVHERMRTFVRTLYADQRLKNTLLPLEDGVMLTIKKKTGEKNENT